MANLEFVENENIADIRLLNQTIESFNGAAFKFETYYRHLEERVRELDYLLYLLLCGYFCPLEGAVGHGLYNWTSLSLSKGLKGHKWTSLESLSLYIQSPCQSC